MEAKEEDTKKPDSAEDEARERARETERLESLRERLYARGNDAAPRFARHDLGTSNASVSEHIRPQTPAPAPAPLVASSSPIPMTSSARRSFRTKLVLTGMIFFIVALAASAGFLFLGKNSISGSNISIDVNGPIAVGGGDAVNMQIAIANQNAIPIESATLIITYPRGAQSATEPGKELFSERQQLNNINAGEVVNIPVKLLMFGEENDTKKITVSVEYRVQGSNATFYKEALPFEFKISSSPLVVSVDSVKSIPSGQETEIELTIQSNAPAPLTDILIKARYPQGFDFTKASQETVSGEDTWRIKELKPTEKYSITITGAIAGSEKSALPFDFTVGVANERDAFNIVSTLATAKTEIAIEKPFLDVEVSVNGDMDDVVVIEPTSAGRVMIQFTNVLESTVYDGVIRVALDGNALDEIMVRPEDGFYDSTKNTIVWDSVGVRELRELAPGAKHTVAFTVEPRDDIRENPEITLAVSIQGNRVGEDDVPEQVIGTVERTIKIASMTNLASSALYSEGPFENAGPIPPVAEKTTQYTFLLTVKNGTNPVTGAEVTAVLPQYITWLDMVSAGDNVTYNASSRTIKWTVGDLASNAYEEAWVQVAFTPSLAQVNRTPTLLELQRFRATDRFTNTIVRDDAAALTTSLTNDPDEDARDGRVRED